MRLRSHAVSSLVFALSLLPFASSGETRVFANLSDGTPNNGAFQGALFYTATPPRQLYLYVELGTADYGGQACRTGVTGGDEVCAYDVTLQIDGPGYISAFSGESGITSWPTDFTSNNVKRLGVARIDTSASSPLPRYIGTITVTGVPNDVTRLLVADKAPGRPSQAVDAALQPRNLPAATLATLPEPGSIAQLASGALAVALLHRWRRASAS